MKKFAVYLEDRAGVYKIAVPAENEKAARKYVEGNGEIITVKDVTEEYPISAGYIADALTAYGFGEFEKDLVVRALQDIDIAE